LRLNHLFTECISIDPENRLLLLTLDLRGYDKKSTFNIVLISSLTVDGCISQLFVGWQFQFSRINEIFESGRFRRPHVLVARAWPRDGPNQFGWKEKWEKLKSIFNFKSIEMTRTEFNDYTRCSQTFWYRDPFKNIF
jgi:hypothetical protein